MNPKSILNMTLIMLLVLFFIFFFVWVYNGVRNPKAVTAQNGPYTVVSNFAGFNR